VVLPWMIRCHMSIERATYSPKCPFNSSVRMPASACLTRPGYEKGCSKLLKLP